MSAFEAEAPLKSLYNETMSNIADTFTRFIDTAEYTRYKLIRVSTFELADVGGLGIENYMIKR